MLQQTQVARVAVKFPEFIKKFGGWSKLAAASRGEVLIAWQGLGYNRRAKALHDLAKEVVSRYGGAIPSDTAQLLALPGVGTYTAAAIRAFAFNLPEVVIETNIRAVFLQEFFQPKQIVRDVEILPLIIVSLSRRNPREWYYALMDYGSALKRRQPQLGRQSAHYVKQSPFRGSRREIRGKILKLLANAGPQTGQQIHGALGATATPTATILLELLNEGLIRRSGGRYKL
jgi:A/G-specific adenine glycosylase